MSRNTLLSTLVVGLACLFTTACQTTTDEAKATDEAAANETATAAKASATDQEIADTQGATATPAAKEEEDSDDEDVGDEEEGEGEGEGEAGLPADSTTAALPTIGDACSKAIAKKSNGAVAQPCLTSDAFMKSLKLSEKQIKRIKSLAAKVGVAH